MSKKEVRARSLLEFKYKKDNATSYLENSPENLRLLERARRDLEESWGKYENAHFDYIFKEKNQEETEAAIVEHRDANKVYDELGIKLDERIETLEIAAAAPVEAPAPELSAKQKADGIISNVTDKSLQYSGRRIKQN